MEKRFQKELESYKKLGFLNQYNLRDEEAAILSYSYSVRSVILLENNKIVLVKVSRDNYHSIVGGHIEDGEEIEESIIRESREESGYDISIIISLGYLEYWKKKYKKYDFCFLAKAIGEQKPLSLTDKEIELGHEVGEYTFEEAIKILENEVKTMNNPVSERSLIFIKEAKKYL